MIGTEAMYNFASKLFNLFIDPTVLTLLLLICAWMFHKRHAKLFRGLYLAAILLLGFMACPITSDWLINSLEKQYPDKGIEGVNAAQAIVVLGGSLKMPSETHPNSGLTSSSDRLLEALRLYRAGKAPLIAASGGDNPLLMSAREVHEAEEMRSLLEEWGVPESAIVVEDASVNTHENAIFTKRILEARGIQHIILVTSAIHMPRASAAFRKAGFDVEAVPADFVAGRPDEATIFAWVPASGALVNSNSALHEWIGIWVYRLRGWA
jgi:uncharacterized SAM-binding protein YcdF (DUF218 family)